MAEVIPTVSSTTPGYESKPGVPSWSTVWWTCAQLGLWNWDDLCDRQFDALNNQALVEQDQSRRNDMYIEMQQRWDKQASMAWVAHPTSYYAWKQSKVDPAIRPDGRPYLSGLPDVRAPEPRS